MKILVTGANGFIGKNLVTRLENNGYTDIFKFDKDTDKELLNYYAKNCDFVFHLAGSNRPVRKEEFEEVNVDFTRFLLDCLKRYRNKSPILFTSSIQAEDNNAYGSSKKNAEDMLFNYGKDSKVSIYIYRLPNVFGKWSKPNYNSVVATFCYNISRGLDIKINKEAEIKLCYIDDVIDEFFRAMLGNPTFSSEFNIVPVVNKISIDELASIIKSFKNSRESLNIPNMNNDLIKKLYSTYLSFVPKNDFSYNLKMNIDDRGSFTEFIKTPDRGQVSINISKPGITKGNHWHHSKNEKFLVVSGEALLRFRRVNEDEVIEYVIRGDNLQVVDIPVGYTHSIVNIGDKDLITIMWANECYNPRKPDTYYLEV